MQESSDKFDVENNIIDDVTPPYSELRGIYKKSFAYYTLRTRLPCTLNNVISNLQCEFLRLDLIDIERKEFTQIIEYITRLKESLETNGTLDYFECHASQSPMPDRDAWNRFLNEIPIAKRTFFQVCWLYAECYLYRRLSFFFESSKILHNYDYFQSQKTGNLQNAMQAMEQIAAGLQTRKDIEYFANIIRLCLWSNRCDLSISSGNTIKPMDNLLDGARKLDPHLLIDATTKIWQCLDKIPKGTAIIDFICDNAGFELFTDFLLADYFLHHRFAAKVRFHIKSIPWFVSDTISSDVDSLLDTLCNISKVAALNTLGDSWRKNLETGKFELLDKSRFWTGPFEYCKMPLLDTELYNCLSQAQLLIFKGDLNYRKLLGDFNWSFTDEFQKTLRGFAPSNLCALRTVKGDLISGLPQGLAEKIKITHPDWMTTGEFGVIQFANC